MVGLNASIRGGSLNWALSKNVWDAKGDPQKWFVKSTRVAITVYRGEVYAYTLVVWGADMPTDIAVKHYRQAMSGNRLLTIPR